MPGGITPLKPTIKLQNLFIVLTDPEMIFVIRFYYRLKGMNHFFCVNNAKPVDKV